MKKSLTENFIFCVAERKNDGILSVFECKKVTNFALSLESKPEITVRGFGFHYSINSCACLRRQFPKYGRPITKSFLGTVLTIVFGARILSKII